jgi:hypothetical protein
VARNVRISCFLHDQALGRVLWWHRPREAASPQCTACRLHPRMPPPPQEYVHARIMAFAEALMQRLVLTGLTPAQAQACLNEALMALPPPPPPQQQQNLQLVFRHDCMWVCLHVGCGGCAWYCEFFWRACQPAQARMITALLPYGMHNMAMVMGLLCAAPFLRRLGFAAIHTSASSPPQCAWMSGPAVHAVPAQSQPSVYHELRPQVPG